MLWNVKQVAKFLGISNSMVYKMAANNELPCVKIGTCIRFAPETIENITKRIEKDIRKDLEAAMIYNSELGFNSQYMI